MPVLNHTHTYVKYKKRRGYFRCDHPDCTHFQIKELVIGKTTCCTECGSPFVLDKEMAKRARPRCLRCAKTKQARAFQAAGSIMDKLLEKNNENT